MTMARIAIIGAGASGLTAIKCLKDEGLTPVCFERSNYYGGLWYFTEDVEEGQACVNRSTIINTSKEMMCFSDFPIPKEFPNFLHNRKVMEYFSMYAKHFNLLQYIKFQTEVKNVRKADDFSTSGQWVLKVKNKTSEEITEEIFDAVLLCTGHHAEKYMPTFPGEEIFKGKRIHSHDYKDGSGYDGKRVVVVGIGNSGADVAVELSRNCGQVFLSTRRGAWILNRIADYGVPVDMNISRRLAVQLKEILPSSLFNSFIEGDLNKRFDHQLYGLKPKHRFDGQHPTLNDEMPNRIASGSIQIRSNIARITETGVEFEDGTFEDDIDVIIYATGYIFGFPYLEPGIIDVKKNQIDLYKYCFHPTLQQPTIAVIGCTQPVGAIMPISELQCRWAARVFKGQLKLPPSEVMLADIQKKKDLMVGRYVNTQRHTIQVDWIPFMDELAEHVGCKPDLFRVFLTDPQLAWEMWTGPCTPYHYRLKGPGQWPGARKAILTQWDRCHFPLQTRKPLTTKSSRVSFMLIFKIVFVCFLGIIIRWLFT